MAPETDLIKEVLQRASTIAIVGVSDKPERPSHDVARFLIEKTDYRIYMVNPALTLLFGMPVYPTLSAAIDVNGPIEIVNVFRRVEEMGPILDEAISKKAKVFWMQLGLRDNGLASRAESAGLKVIQDRCIKIEITSLRGSSQQS